MHIVPLTNSNVVWPWGSSQLWSHFYEYSPAYQFPSPAPCPIMVSKTQCYMTDLSWVEYSGTDISSTGTILPLKQLKIQSVFVATIPHFWYWVGDPLKPSDLFFFNLPYSTPLPRTTLLPGRKHGFLKNTSCQTNITFFSDRITRYGWSGESLTVWILDIMSIDKYISVSKKVFNEVTIYFLPLWSAFLAII